MQLGIRFIFHGITIVATCCGIGACADGPVKVEVYHTAEGYQLLRDGQPHYVQGAVNWTKPDNSAYPLSGVVSRGGKAQVIAERYQNTILADTTHCLGSFVFYWSEKQETTHTWYGLFCGGMRTESIDVMQRFWTGAWPENRAPALESLGIAGFPDLRSVSLQAGQTYRAEARVTDPDADPLEFTWDIRPEVEIPAGSYAGSMEKRAQPIAGLIGDPTRAQVQFTAPQTGGAYRLFVTAADGHGHVAYGNIPFLVTED